MSSNTIIGIAGMIATGKGTIANYLVEHYGATTFRFSEILQEVLSLYDLEQSRQNIQTLSTMLRQSFGENVLAKSLVKKTKNSTASLIVIDGVRRLIDTTELKTLANFHLIGVVADPQIRYQRHLDRGRLAGDREMTFAEFQQRDLAETELQIPSVVTSADYTIDNSGSHEALYQQIDAMMAKIGYARKS